MTREQRTTIQFDPPSSLLYDIRATMRAERRAKWFARFRAMHDAYVTIGATAGMVALVIEICKH